MRLMITTLIYGALTIYKESPLNILGIHLFNPHDSPTTQCTTIMYTLWGGTEARRGLACHTSSMETGHL